MLNYSVAELRININNNHYEDEFNLTCLFPSYLKDMSGTRKMTIFDSQSQQTFNSIQPRKY